MKEKLGFSHLGNGVIVWDENRTKSNDYLTLAHINYNREVTYYTKSISNEAKAKIELFVRTENMQVSMTEPGLALKPVQTEECPTRVVNLKNENYDVYIGRTGRGQDGYFGNPIRLAPGARQGSTLEQYRKYFYDRLETDPEFKRRIHTLKGKALGCFCKPGSCHGDIIKEYLDNQ